VTDAYIIGLGRQTMTLALELCAPLLVLGLAAGLVISIFQAATQIQEMTLSFLPKVLAMAAGVVLFGPWMLTRLMEFTTQIFNEMPKLVK
jgi:flagellar biosynthetic protein FliQ